MVGENACRTLLAQAAAEADLILIEGVMGLFDGTPSSADLARAFNVPVLAVISAKSMAQTFGAVAFGLARFRPDVPFYGVLANRVGSARHAHMLEESLEQRPEQAPAPPIRWCGHIAAAATIELPDRHLGLHQADEIDDLDARLERAADALASTALVDLPPPVDFGETEPLFEGVPPLLAGRHIAIARDAAFSFIYPANLALLEALGARLSYFSPLADEALPEDTDALYLPGGYPELHAAALAHNMRRAASIRAHAAAGRPVMAECGGMLYLLDQLTDTSGTITPMLGLLPGHATMQRRFTALGMQQIDSQHGPMTGHTFHYSTLTTPLAAVRSATRPHSDVPGEAVYRSGSIVATYMHAYWPSNPAFAAALFNGEAF
jgi:cobyrinic acid a,c-diamide synthase